MAENLVEVREYFSRDRKTGGVTKTSYPCFECEGKCLGHPFAASLPKPETPMPMDSRREYPSGTSWLTSAGEKPYRPLVNSRYHGSNHHCAGNANKGAKG